MPTYSHSRVCGGRRQAPSRRLSGILLYVLASSIVACAGGPAEPEISLVSLAIYPEQVALDAWGLGHAFQVRAQDAEGRVYGRLPLTWTSSSPSVARVDSMGKATTVGNGTTRITVSGYGLSASATLTVLQHPFQVLAELARDSVSLGDTVRATARVVDRAGTNMPSERVRWESIWPALATVDSTGLVSTIRSGHAEIAAVWTDQVDAKEDLVRLAIGDTAFLARVPLGGWPWAIAQSSRGVVYVTQDMTGQVSRLSLSPPGVSVTFAVGATPRAISFTPDGARAFVALHTEPAIAVLDVAGDSVIARYPVQARVYDVAAMPDSTAYFLTDWGGATTCFFRLDPDASDPIIPIMLAGQWTSLARDPTRPIIYVSGIGGITVFRTDTQQFTNEGLGAGVTGRLAVTPDGGKLLGFGGGGVEVWDLTTLTLTGTIPTWGSGIALTTDGQRAYIPQWGYGDVVIVDVPNLAVVRYMFLGDSPRDAVLVNDSLLLVTNESGWVDHVRAER